MCFRDLGGVKKRDTVCNDLKKSMKKRQPITTPVGDAILKRLFFLLMKNYGWEEAAATSGLSGLKAVPCFSRPLCLFVFSCKVGEINLSKGVRIYIQEQKKHFEKTI